MTQELVLQLANLGGLGRWQTKENSTEAVFGNVEELQAFGFGSLYFLVFLRGCLQTKFWDNSEEVEGSVSHSLVTSHGSWRYRCHISPLSHAGVKAGRGKCFCHCYSSPHDFLA